MSSSVRICSIPFTLLTLYFTPYFTLCSSRRKRLFQDEFFHCNSEERLKLDLRRAEDNTSNRRYGFGMEVGNLRKSALRTIISGNNIETVSNISKSSLAGLNTYSDGLAARFLLSLSNSSSPHALTSSSQSDCIISHFMLCK